jgi:hypothetical protein
MSAAKPKIPATTALSTSTGRQRPLAQMGKLLGKLPGTPRRTVISTMAQGDHRAALVRGTKSFSLVNWFCPRLCSR